MLWFSARLFSLHVLAAYSGLQVPELGPSSKQLRAGKRNMESTITGLWGKRRWRVWSNLAPRTKAKEQVLKTRLPFLTYLLLHCKECLRLQKQADWTFGWKLLLNEARRNFQSPSLAQKRLWGYLVSSFRTHSLQCGMILVPSVQGQGRYLCTPLWQSVLCTLHLHVPRSSKNNIAILPQL